MVENRVFVEAESEVATVPVVGYREAVRGVHEPECIAVEADGDAVVSALDVDVVGRVEVERGHRSWGRQRVVWQGT